MRQKTLKFEFHGIEGAFMKVAMIGTGYVGLVSGVCFSGILDMMWFVWIRIPARLPL